MSEIPDEHRLFQLVQLVGLAEYYGDHVHNKTLLSCAVTPCGGGKVAVATLSHHDASLHSESENLSNKDVVSSPLVVSLSLEDDNSFRVHWSGWYADPGLRPRVVALSWNGEVVVVACRDGIIAVGPLKSLCPPLTAGEVASKKGFKLVQVPKKSEDREAECRRRLQPTSLSWWSTPESKALALVGTHSGYVVIVDLVDGKEIGYTKPSDKPIVKLEQLADNANDCLYLFITDGRGKQWRQLLEQRSSGYTWCGANENASLPKTPTLEKAAGSNGTKLLDPDDSSPLQQTPGSGIDRSDSNEDLPARSRLAGLKQMSVASLANLRQRLSEGRRLLDRRVGGGANQTDHKDYMTVPIPDGCPGTSLPEALASKVGDTQLEVQEGTTGHGGKILSGLFPDTAILTMHNCELEVLPQAAFRLPKATSKVLFLDKVMLAGSEASIKVVSAHHAEISLDKSKEDPVLQTFTLPKDEHVFGFYRLTPSKSLGATESSSAESSSAESSPTPTTSQEESGSSQMSDPRDHLISEVQLRVTGAKARGETMFKPCLVATTKGLYLLKSDVDPVTTFLECATGGDFKAADRVAHCFDLDSKGLLELAADIRLTKRDFGGAIALYHLSGCKHLKAVLKFAASGHVQELLSYLSVLFKTPNLEVSSADRIHLSNLALMAYFQQALGSEGSNAADIRKRIRVFLDDNSWFDECLAVRLAAETREWNLLGHLCCTRGLHMEMLAAIASAFSQALSSAEGSVKQLQESMTKLLMDMPANERQGLVACLVGQRDNLANCIATGSGLGEEILRILIGLLPLLEESDLLALIDQARPDRPVFRPIFWPLLFARKHGAGEGGGNAFPLMLLNFYVTVQLLVLKKKNKSECCDPVLVKVLSTRKKHLPGGSVARHKRGKSVVMAAGFAHVLLVRPRSGEVLSWGSAHFGVLGHANSAMAPRHSMPKPVDFFHNLGKTRELVDKGHQPRITVMAVSCGRCHSVALTDCGLYVWGSSKYGQLGLGPDRLMAKKPALVIALADHILTTVAAGHYHTAAVDEHGKVYTWGWGVHGQLGHGSIEDEFVPKRLLILEPVETVACGHAHTLVLTGRGTVWAFGCGLFGQLGTGENRKSTIPQRVEFPGAPTGRIGSIACGYFHNLAASRDGKVLYTWGCNPQVLRLEAQQKKKDRLQQQVVSRAVADEDPVPAASPPATTVINSLRKQARQALDDMKGGVVNDPETDDSGAEKFPEIRKDSAVDEDEMVHLRPTVVDTSLFTVASIACGNQHSIILTSSGSVLAFGRNLDGQLGHGSRKEAKLPTLVAGLKEDVVVQIAAGGDYCLALSDTGSVFAWGNNAGGQLGKLPIDEGAGKDGGTNKVLVMKSTKRIIRLQHSLQNSCDVPKPVQGITSGVYPNESYDQDQLDARYAGGMERMRKRVAAFRALSAGTISGDQRRLLHVTLEAFHTSLESKKLIKKCLVSDNPQAAAKISLLSGHLMQSFDFTLQAYIKSGLVGKDIFDAFLHYLHFQTNRNNNSTDVAAPRASDSDSEYNDVEAKRQLLERLIACWQDQKFSFVQLEKLFLQNSDALLLHILVLTLFCPNEDRSVDSGPVLSKDTGPKLVDLFTPEFCLKVGDTFVKSIQQADTSSSASPEHRQHPAVDRWLQRQQQEKAVDGEGLGHLVSQLVVEANKSQ